MVLSDEIYGRILYEGEHVSIASLPGMAERTIVLDGFSKTYAMTGWRLGYAIVPEALVFGFGRLIINSISAPPTFAQDGAVEALTGPQDAVDAMVAEFQARRDLIVDGLNAIPGVNCLRPTGRVLRLPRHLAGPGTTGAELADRLLNEAGVSVLSGTAFGDRRHRTTSASATPTPRGHHPAALERMRTVLEPAAARSERAPSRPTTGEVTWPPRSPPSTSSYAAAEPDFERWEVVKDLVDECIDLALNYRQSGHPGGSRSKVHLLLATLLSGAMRWDLRQPWRRFGDRFVLSAGHTVPARLRDAGRPQRGAPGAPRARRRSPVRVPRRRALGADLGGPARRSATAAGCRATPRWPARRSSSSSTPARPATACRPPPARRWRSSWPAPSEVKVFVVEGEGGLTPGAAHETKNTAWGLGLSNLVFLVDWNDFGIDERPASSVVHGTPDDWFRPYGWRVTGTEDGMDWAPVTRAVLEAARGDNPDRVPIDRLVPDPQGPRLRQVRRQEPRHAAPA